MTLNELRKLQHAVFFVFIGFSEISRGFFVFPSNTWTRFVEHRGKRMAIIDIKKVSLLSRVLIAAGTTSAGEPKNKGQRRL